MLDGAKRKMMERAMSSVTPSETPVAQALAEIIAGLEHEQAQAMERLVDAADLDDVDVRHDVDAREQQLLDLADAVAEDRVAEYYLSQVETLDSPEKAAAYAGMESEAWEKQKREWYSKYTDADVVDGPPVEEAEPADIHYAADIHTNQVFGLDVSAFEQIVVNYERGEVTQELLAGPLVGHTELINYVAGVLEGDES